jgi:hypothetical protein
VSVTLELAFKRGSSVRELLGRSDRYGLETSPPISGTPIKSKRILRYSLDVGYYVAQEHKGDKCGECKSPKPSVRYLRVTDATIEVMPTGLDYAKIASGPKPNEPGSWMDDRCKCGNLTEGLDVDGMPTCGDCVNIYGVDADDLPDPLGVAV